MQLSEAVDLFVSRPDIADATKRTYLYDLIAMQDYIGAGKPVNEIIPADILRYFIYLDRKESITSDHTYNKHVTSVRAFFKFCVAMQMIEKSPIGTLKKKKVSHLVDQSKAMPDVKLRRLLEYVSETPRGWNPREEALVRFFADTGARSGGARTLTWEHIDFAERRATTFEKGKLEPHSKIFGRECSRALAAWKLKQDCTEGPYVFSTDGRMMKEGNLGQYFKRLCHRAGIGTWHPHSLRHRFAHKAIKQFDVSKVAGMIGDTVEVTVQHYLPKDKKAIEDAMRQMSTDHFLSSPEPELLSLIRKEGS